MDGRLIDATAHEVVENVFVHIARNLTKSCLADIHQNDLGKGGGEVGGGERKLKASSASLRCTKSLCS